jgi:hypothetical protein
LGFWSAATITVQGNVTDGRVSIISDPNAQAGQLREIPFEEYALENFLCPAIKTYYWRMGPLK